MSYLFIDSTYDLVLGVLDDGLSWRAFEKNSGQKASAIIQTKTYEMLSSLGLRVEELKGIITVNGPGFYTGLRLSEGFADVLSFFGVERYSFYSYEIPRWCGYTQGTWFTKAYRGEYFLYNWENESSEQRLLSSKDLASNLDNQKLFIHSEASLDALSSELIKEPIATTILLQEHPQRIFRGVLESEAVRESFYFRAPEDEFKVNP